MAILMDGKAVAASVRGEIKEKVAAFAAKNGVTPKLVVIIVGDDPASAVYVKNKHKDCLEVGMLSDVIALPATTTQDELIALIRRLNADDAVHGILVQLPLPKPLSAEAVIAEISPEKDVDAFCDSNVGRIMQGRYSFLPCTPAGVMTLLSHYNIPIAGKECVVVGRSDIVGKPMAMLLLHANGTVTVCHSRTADLASHTRRADILVVAIGKADFVTGDMIKEGAVVVDIGMNRRADGTLTGDVDFASAEPKASYITPVPGGVGPMTRVTLLENTLTAAEAAVERAK